MMANSKDTQLRRLLLNSGQNDDHRRRPSMPVDPKVYFE
jgi:hypothetical protein